MNTPLQVGDIAGGVVNIISDTSTAGQTYEFVGYVSCPLPPSPPSTSLTVSPTAGRTNMSSVIWYAMSTT